MLRHRFRRGSEVVITRRSWKPFVLTGTWVRIPSSPLMRSRITIKEYSKEIKLLKIILDIRCKKWYYIKTYFVGICLEKYPSWPKGLPWKGSRSGEPARGFKSLFLRSASPVMQMMFEPLQSNIWQLKRNATLKIFLKEDRDESFKNGLHKNKFRTNQTKQITEQI